MSTLVAQMTKDELIEVIETIIERKLLEILSTFDEEVNLKQTVRERLLRQKQMVKDGERGQSFDAVVQQLGLG
jgi:restriction endonuclease S subunit